MELGGERRIALSQEETWRALNDLAILRAAIPGCQKLEQTDPFAYSAEITSRIGPVSARFRGTMTLQDVRPPHGYRMLFEGAGGIAGFAKGEATVTLRPDGPVATVLTYTARATVGGKLAQIGSRLVDSVAARTAEQFFSAFCRQIDAPPPIDDPGSEEASPPRFAQTNGIRTCYDVRGDGPWIVLSHSLACDRTMWDEQTAVLSRQFKVLRYDTRGHGGSEAPGGRYSLEMLADDLAGLFDALQIDSTHFVGLSMGGMIGQTFALRHPGRLRSLVLCDTTSRYPPGTAAVWQARVETARSQGMTSLVSSTLGRWFTESFRLARPEVLERFARAISATPVAGYAGCSEALPPIDVTASLGKLAVPALVIVGEHDPGTPVAMAREIADNLPGAELAILEDAAHLSNVEQPVAFNLALMRFLDRVCAQP